MIARTNYLAPDPYAQCLTCETWFCAKSRSRCDNPKGHTFKWAPETSPLPGTGHEVKP